MQGKQIIIDALNRLLANELAAADQYFIHSRMYEDMGLTKLFERISHESDDEKQHAAVIIERILFLGGTPNLVARDELLIGNDVKEMLENDLQFEYGNQALLKDTIALCEKEQDYVTRKELTQLLDDTENDHAHWLEKQVKLVELLGVQNYMQSQV